MCVLRLEHLNPEGSLIMPLHRPLATLESILLVALRPAVLALELKGKRLEQHDSDAVSELHG